MEKMAISSSNVQRTNSSIIDSETLIGTVSNKPKDAALDIGNYELTTLLEDGTLTVGKVVAD